MTNQEIGYSVELLRYGPNQDEVAAAAFLARYGGRTLDAYRQVRIPVISATQSGVSGHLASEAAKRPT